MGAIGCNPLPCRLGENINQAMVNLKDKLKSILGPGAVRTVLFYLAAGLIIHLDRFILGAHALIKTHDQFDSYWPFQKALAERIVHFQMPGWLPDFAGGIPFFIWDVNWVFLPMIIHGLFPEPWSITAITIIQFLLAGCGAHLLLRRFFETDESVSFLGGLLWAVSTFNLTYWRIFDLAAIPMIFYCTDRIAFTDDRKTRFLLIGVMLLCAMNLWLIKGAIFLIPFHFFFILFVRQTWTERKKVFMAYGLFWAFVAILNLPMITSLLTNATYSSRNLIQWPAQDISLWSVLNSFFWFLFNPIHQSSITLGFVASLVVFFSILNFRKWSPLTRKSFYYYIAVLFFAHFIIYSRWFLSFWTSLPISGFRLYKIIFIGPFVLFILAMTNMNSFIEFLRGSQRKVFLLILITAAIPCVYQLLMNAFPSNYIEAFVILLFAVITFMSLIVLRNKGAGTKAYVILLMALIFSERFVQANLARPADVKPPSFTHFYTSDLFDRFRPAHKHDYRIAFINQHASVGLYNNHQVAGGIGQYSKRYYYFWDALITGEAESKAFRDYYHMAYLLDENSKRETSPPHTIKQPGFSTDLLALHNVRYIFSFNEIENPGRWGLSLVHQGIPAERAPGLKRGLQVLKRIFEPIPYYVYEVKQCLPRVFAAESYELVEGRESLKDYLRLNTIENLGGTVVYNREDLSPADIGLLKTLRKVPPLSENRGREGAARPQVTYYSDNKILIHVTSPSPRQLVLNENYFRDWTATIDGRPAPILPAYGVFRSVVLDKGFHQVVFEYKPVYLVTSLWISGLGSLIFLAGCFSWAYTGRAESEVLNHA